MGISYREARTADAQQIVAFQIAMARETESMALDPHVCSRGVDAVFRDPSLGRYFVAVEEDRVIASLLITYEWSDWRNGMVWWIQSVYVLPPARGQRVYAGLYGYVKELASRENARGIRLYVDRTNAAAQKVYARLGMNGDHYVVFEWMKEEYEDGTRNTER